MWLSNATNSLLQVGAVDCQSSEDLCKAHGVTFRTTISPKLLVHIWRAKGRSNAVQYPGEWTVKALRNFYIKQLSAISTSLDHQNFVQAMSKAQEQPQAILVRKTKDPPVAWAALCGEFENQIEFYDIQVRMTQGCIGCTIYYSNFINRILYSMLQHGIQGSAFRRLFGYVFHVLMDSPTVSPWTTFTFLYSKLVLCRSMMKWILLPRSLESRSSQQ